MINPQQTPAARTAELAVVLSGTERNGFRNGVVTVGCGDRGAAVIVQCADGVSCAWITTAFGWEHAWARGISAFSRHSCYLLAVA
mmetsp:Transcript_46257/g.100527  ORF Transcript_46257/g.100527 Transcript_46257/m.100527 type:complete len:85 (+) Transcript_46257:666-920(+)